MSSIDEMPLFPMLPMLPRQEEDAPLFFFFLSSFFSSTSSRDIWGYSLRLTSVCQSSYSASGLFQEYLSYTIHLSCALRSASLMHLMIAERYSFHVRGICLSFPDGKDTPSHLLLPLFRDRILHMVFESLFENVVHKR